MNDNIIKMFIGGEEVVSNKEFTINEEMLSASSTILNNCYPANWEETKDYVSNFYYPKDYSKFILGKGNFTYGTDQYSILSVSGETFMQFTTNVEKEWNSFNVYGNTYQETRSGKNLLNATKYSSTNYISQLLTLKATTYTVSFDGENANGIYVRKADGTSPITGTTVAVAFEKKQYTFTLTEEGQYYIQFYKASPGWSSFSNAQLEEGSVATEYEPYGVMPSPDFPSELVNVGYENLLSVPFTQVSANIIRSNIDNFKKGTYTFRFKGSLTPTWQVTAYKIVNGTRSSLAYKYNVYELSFTLDEEATLQLEIYYGNGIELSEISKPILLKGTQPHSYIPYGKYGIEVKNIGKNLISNANKVGNTLYFNNALNQDYYIFKAGTYTFSFKSTTTPSIYKRTATTNATSLGTTNPITITSNEDFNLWLYRSGMVEGEITDIQLEKGTQATIYEPYKENTQLYQLDEPLRAIGEYKDKLYIENGMLYVERKIGSVVLNGSENWALHSSSSGSYRYWLRSTNFKNIFNNIITGSETQLNDKIKCDYFIQVLFANTSVGKFSINNLGSNDWFLLNVENNTLTNFKDWLSTHNTEVQYVLAEPYTESIGQVDIPYSYEGINNTTFDTGIDTEETIYYYWKNYDVLFAGIVKNSGDISLRPTNPKYCSLQILDYKTFLSESDTLDFVISDKTIAEAISMVVDAISGYGFVLGTINISQADDIIGAYSTLNKTAYDVFQYLANISGSRWRARFVDSDTMAIDFYDPELLPRANDIDYTQQYWEDNKIVDLTFNYGTRDYRNKQIILSDEVYGGIDYTEVLLSNGYGTSYITQNNIANITSITVNGVEAEVITQSEKDLGVDADFYYTPGKNVVESTTSYTAGTQIIITYTPLVKGRQIVYNDEEVTRIATQTNTTGVISRYENRNDILSSDELENIAESYIKYKGKPEIILKLTTLNNDLFNIGEICYFNSPIADLAQDYMVKSKATNYTSVAGETNIFYTYELTSSFNSEKAINYFDNQRNKATGNIAEGESITRNIDINNSAMIIWENATITEISVSVDGDNALNSVLNSPFIQ